MRVAIFLIFINGLSCRSQFIENQIVMVNVEQLDRDGIAKEIAIINSFNPKVIAVDLEFIERRGEKDMALVDALWNCKSLVMSSLFEEVGDGKVMIHAASQLEFMPLQAKTGFINALLEEDSLQTLEKFIVKQREFIEGRVEYHFAVSTAMAFDSLRSIEFVNNNPSTVAIDYKYGKRKFKKFSAEDIFNGKINRGDINGKIVLIGILGPGDEDKFFTPLNDKERPYEPDMYGLEILANIIAQILEHKSG